MNTRQVVVVGCGGIWPVWRQLLADRKIAVRAVVDRDLDRARAAAADFPAARPLANVADAVEALGDTVDTLVTLTPADAHAETIMFGLAAGLDVITEKPLVVNVADGSRIVMVAAAAGRRVSVMQNRRYEASFVPFAAFAAALPGPVHMSCDFFVPWTYGGFRDEVAHPLLDDLLIHTMDQARCLTVAAPDWVFCHESTIADSWMAGDAVVSATVGFTDGSILSYRGSWCSGGEQTSWNGSWRISAHDCSVHWDGHGPAVVVRSELDELGRPTDRTRRITLDAGAPGTGHDHCLDEILGALARGGHSATDAAANLDSVAMVEAARRSCALGRAVRLAETYDGDGAA